MNTVTKNEKNYVNQLISRIIDKEGINIDDEFHNKKRKDIERYLIKENLDDRDFTEIQRLAYSKGGFLTNSFRRKLWKKILNVKGNNNIFEFIFISDNYSEKVFFQRSNINDKNLKSNYDTIIDLDIHRSIINSLLNSKENVNEIKIIKEELRTLLKRNCSILNGMYHYYQGFHDFALYIMILFFDNHNIGALILQRLSEFFLKDFLSENKENETPDFMMINQILSNLILLKEPDTINQLKEKMDYVEPYFALSWILSWFTHNLTNISKIYRIFDFLICSHPLAVFHMAAEIICGEIKNLIKNESTLDQSIYYEKLQNINFNEIDYDYIIDKTNLSLMNFPSSVVLKPFMKSLTRKFYPLANQKSLQLEYIKSKSSVLKKGSEVKLYLIAIIILIVSIMIYFHSTKFSLFIRK